MLNKIFSKMRPRAIENLVNNDIDIDTGILEVIAQLTSENVKVIFDVGAHHGRYSIVASRRFTNADIYCFEPFPNSFSTLKLSLAGAKFNLFPLAVSDIDGITNFHVNNLDETNSLLPSVNTNSQIDELTSLKEIINVKVTTIDKVCNDLKVDSIDVLKIDVQGNTLNVLKGAAALLEARKIKIIQCEIEFLEIYKNQALFHNICLFLEEFGYSLYSLYNIHYDVQNRISWADALYYIND